MSNKRLSLITCKILAIVRLAVVVGCLWAFIGLFLDGMAREREIKRVNNINYINYLNGERQKNGVDLLN